MKSYRTLAVLLLSIFLLFPATGGLSDATISEAAQRFKSGAYEYVVLEDGTAEIVSYEGSDSTLLVTDSLDGKSVTRIGQKAFSNRFELTSITLPDSLKSIGDSAFSWCESLTSITLPDSLKSIEEGAFSFCRRLTSITLPDSLQSIGDGVFKACYNLTAITLPDNLKSIGGEAFSFCYNLTTITLPDSLQSIGDSAFVGCLNLNMITVGRNSYAAQYCKDNNLPYTYPDSLDWLND